MKNKHGRMHQLFGKLLELQRATIEIVTEIVATNAVHDQEDVDMAVIPSSRDKGPVHVRVLDLLNQRPEKLFTPSFVARTLRVQPNSVHVALHRLSAEKHVVCAGKGLYRAIHVRDESL